MRVDSSPLIALPPCHALLVDLDGTLVDSRRDIANALNATLRAHGRQTLPLERILPMIGDGARALVARALDATAVDTTAPDEALLAATVATFQRCYAEEPCVHTKLLPGADALLGLGIPLAIVTNKPRVVTELLLERLGIADRIGAIWAGGDGPLKPAPDGPRKAAEALGVAAERAWFVGDGPQDVLAGRSAGCFTVAVPGIAERERVTAAKPDLVAESLVEVADLARSARVTSA